MTKNNCPISFQCLLIFNFLNIAVNTIWFFHEDGKSCFTIVHRLSTCNNDLLTRKKEKLSWDQKSGKLYITHPDKQNQIEIIPIRSLNTPLLILPFFTDNECLIRNGSAYSFICTVVDGGWRDKHGKKEKIIRR
jgi:hypothetical protein